MALNFSTTFVEDKAINKGYSMYKPHKTFLFWSKWNKTRLKYQTLVLPIPLPTYLMYFKFMLSKYGRTSCRKNRPKHHSSCWFSHFLLLVFHSPVISAGNNSFRFWNQTFLLLVVKPLCSKVVNTSLTLWLWLTADLHCFPSDSGGKIRHNSSNLCGIQSGPLANLLEYRRITELTVFLQFSQDEISSILAVQGLMESMIQ